MIAAIAGTAAPDGSARRCGRRAANRQHDRGRAHLHGGAAGRADRHAAAAPVAPRRCGRRDPARGRQRADRERPHRGDGSFRSRGQCRGRSLHGAPSLRFRAAARRSGLARRSLRHRRARPYDGRRERAGGFSRSGRPFGCGHLGRDGGRAGPGGPQRRPADRRRARGPAREPAAAECRRPVHHSAFLVRRHRDDLAALAGGRRNTGAPPPLRRHDLCGAMPRPSLRCRGGPGTAGGAAGGGRISVGTTGSQERDRSLARARAVAAHPRLAGLPRLR